MITILIAAMLMQDPCSAQQPDMPEVPELEDGQCYYSPCSAWALDRRDRYWENAVAPWYDEACDWQHIIDITQQDILVFQEECAQGDPIACQWVTVLEQQLADALWEFSQAQGQALENEATMDANFQEDIKRCIHDCGGTPPEGWWAAGGDIQALVMSVVDDWEIPDLTFPGVPDGMESVCEEEHGAAPFGFEWGFDEACYAAAETWLRGQWEGFAFGFLATREALLNELNAAEELTDRLLIKAKNDPVQWGDSYLQALGAEEGLRAALHAHYDTIGTVHDRLLVNFRIMISECCQLQEQ